VLEHLIHLSTKWNAEKNGNVTEFAVLKQKQIILNGIMFNKICVVCINCVLLNQY
jgi:hypothetical protein